MTTKRIEREFDLSAGPFVFTSDAADEKDRLNPNLLNNQIEIVSLDVQDGVPAEPTTGDYTIGVRQVKDGNLRTIQDTPVVPAPLTGGSAIAAGTGVSSSFYGSPIEIEITPDSVDVATWCRIVVIQSDI